MPRRRRSYPIAPIPKRLVALAFEGDPPAMPPPRAICGVCGFTAKRWPSNFGPECSTPWSA